MRELTDQEVVEAMVELDDDEDVTVAFHEAGLLETMVQKDKRKDWSLTERQRSWALAILEKYGREI